MSTVEFQAGCDGQAVSDMVALTRDPDYTPGAGTQPGRPAMRRMAHHNPHAVAWTLLCLVGFLVEVVQHVAS